MLVGRYGAVLDADILDSATLRGALLRTIPKLDV